MTTLDRRSFCGLLSAVALQTLAEHSRAEITTAGSPYEIVVAQDRARILRLGAQAMGSKPDPITAHTTAREPVDQPHDFYTEAEYYWPIPDKPKASYRLIDGKPNPDSFVEHRLALSRFSQTVSSLAAAYVLTRKPAHAHAANAHLKAWFVADATRMNSNPEFAGVIRNSGAYPKSLGIMDLLPLAEVARSVACLKPEMTPQMYAAVQAWFRDLLQWLQSSDNGTKERDANSVRAFGWGLRAAEYARLIGDEATRDKIRERLRNIQLPALVGRDGSFPKQLARANSYAESVFAFDLVATLCWALSTSFDPEGDYADFSPKAQHQSSEALAAAQHPGALLRFLTPDGQGACKAAAFIYPYLRTKESWPHAHDAEQWDAPPVRSQGLLFSALACESRDYLALWKQLPADPPLGTATYRSLVRQPILWV